MCLCALCLFIPIIIPSNTLPAWFVRGATLCVIHSYPCAEQSLNYSFFRQRKIRITNSQLSVLYSDAKFHKKTQEECFRDLCHLCSIVRIVSGGTNGYTEGSPLHGFFLLGKPQIITRLASFCVAASKKLSWKVLCQSSTKQFQAQQEEKKNGAKATLSVLGYVRTVPPACIHWMLDSALFGYNTLQESCLQPSVFPSSFQDCRTCWEIFTILYVIFMSCFLLKMLYTNSVIFI